METLVWWERETIESKTQRRLRKFFFLLHSNYYLFPNVFRIKNIKISIFYESWYVVPFIICWSCSSNPLQPDAKADSLEKTLMLGKIEGGRRRGRQRMRWLDGIIDSIDMSLSKLREMVKDRRAWHAPVHGVSKSRTRLSNRTATKDFYCLRISLVFLCTGFDFLAFAELQFPAYMWRFFSTSLFFCRLYKSLFFLLFLFSPYHFSFLLLMCLT